MWAAVQKMWQHVRQKSAWHGHSFPYVPSIPDRETSLRLWQTCYQLRISPMIAVDLLRGGHLPPQYRYRRFYIPKQNGSAREIMEPAPSLKQVQRHIIKYVLHDKEVHAAAYGFRRKKSVAHHVWTHAHSEIIITADIQDFFPSTTSERVKEWLTQQGFDDVMVHLILRLTTFNGALPQGAPTSPLLSNLVNYEMDAVLTQRVHEVGGIYTRYADDLVFSFPSGVRPPSDFELSVRAILRRYGYVLNPVKGWHIWNRREEPTITGLRITRQGTVTIPESMKRIMRELSRRPEAAQRLQGYRGYQHMVEDFEPQRDHKAYRQRNKHGKLPVNRLSSLW